MTSLLYSVSLNYTKSNIRNGLHVHPSVQICRFVQKMFSNPSSSVSSFSSYSLVFSNEFRINPLNPELNPICYLLALLDHHFLHVSRIRVKSLTLRLLTSYIYICIYIYIYIYMEHLFLMFLDHTQRRSTVGRTPLDE